MSIFLLVPMVIAGIMLAILAGVIGLLIYTFLEAFLIALSRVIKDWWRQRTGYVALEVNFEDIGGRAKPYYIHSPEELAFLESELIHTPPSRWAERAALDWDMQQQNIKPVIQLTMKTNQEEPIILRYYPQDMQ